MWYNILGELSDKPEEEMLILGGDGSLEYFSSDTLLFINGNLYTRDTVLTELVESLWYKNIKLEVGQVWLVINNDPFIELEHIKILAIKGRYILYEEVESGIESSIDIAMFSYWDIKYITSDKGFITVRGEVRRINTTNIK